MSSYMVPKRKSFMSSVISIFFYLSCIGLGGRWQEGKTGCESSESCLFPTDLNSSHYQIVGQIFRY